MQVVVMAGGTNDFHATPPPLEEWTSDIISFMNTVSHLACAHCQLRLICLQCCTTHQVRNVHALSCAVFLQLPSSLSCFAQQPWLAQYVLADCCCMSSSMYLCKGLTISDDYFKAHGMLVVRRICRCADVKITGCTMTHAT